MTGKADFFADGQWNFYCDLCGAKTKSGEGTRTWDNFYVCKHHKEERNPQDFVRGVRENQSLPWTRPMPPNDFAGIDYTRTFADTVTSSESLARHFSPLLAAETSHSAEAISLITTNPMAEVGHSTETFSITLTSPTSRLINGSALNTQPLG